MIEKAFLIEKKKNKMEPAVVYLPDLDVGGDHLSICIFVYVPNLDVGEGHETLDIN